MLELTRRRSDSSRRSARGAPRRRPAPVWRKAEPAAPRGSDGPGHSRAVGRRGPGSAAAGRLRRARPRAACRPARSPPRRRPPARRPAVAPGRGRLQPPASPARAPGDLPDERVRQLYAQYVETKRQQSESTAAITFEAVAKSLRDSSAKLREKHGKNVDFEVAVKDGKTILKPVLK